MTTIEELIKAKSKSEAKAKPKLKTEQPIDEAETEFYQLLNETVNLCSKLGEVFDRLDALPKRMRRATDGPKTIIGNNPVRLVSMLVKARLGFKFQKESFACPKQGGK